MPANKKKKKGRGRTTPLGHCPPNGRSSRPAPPLPLLPVHPQIKKAQREKEERRKKFEKEKEKKIKKTKEKKNTRFQRQPLSQTPFWLCSEKQNPKRIYYKCREQPIDERGAVGDCQNRRTIYRQQKNFRPALQKHRSFSRYDDGGLALVSSGPSPCAGLTDSEC